MKINTQEISEKIISTKKMLKANNVDYKVAFEKVTAVIKKEIADIKQEIQDGINPVPILEFDELKNNSVTNEQIEKIKQRGCLVVRGVFNPDKVSKWNKNLADYLEKNNYLEKQKEKAGIDTYFSTLKDSKPQIYGIYWSKAQMEARTSQELATTRSWLNHLWKYETDGKKEFDPDQDCLYADRARQREPGDMTLGLSPHIDGGSVERWIEPSYREVYRHIISGNTEQYDPYDGLWRTQTKEIPSPAVCSMFRTFQGWTALTKQGPGDGTLNLVPISKAMVWVFLRALQDDVEKDSLCGAAAGKAMVINEEYHALLLEAYTPIPTVHPGDTVWWHSDVIHGVENHHKGTEYSNVIYTGSAPDCKKNRTYLKKQQLAFEAGESAPDFASENYEVDFKGRFLKEDLNELGMKQMGYVK